MIGALARARMRLSWRQLQWRHRGAAVPGTFDWDWTEQPFDRTALVNLIAARSGATSYLEIGCDQDTLFRAVPIADKVGVDPARGGTVRTTSDAFFASNDRQFDLVFIDGLHVYDQVRRDVVGALSVLNPGGWILLHDMLPRNWREEHVPRIQDEWTGDVWKVAVELAATPDLDFAIAAIDHGVGMVRPRVQGSRLADRSDDLVDARFAAFSACMPALPILPWSETQAWIARVAPARSPGPRS